ncbi:hypothetical protein [Listeria goaensis]|uniref:hypothetical protein n=1 Tax=Listeria goaensis TaxID=1649188 RepID=UPI000B5968DF|nr:hypothetical protein [Listeria goaensis]
MQTILETEQNKVVQTLRNEKWLLIELIYGYCLFETDSSLTKSDLAEYSLDQLEFIEQAIENRTAVKLERGA